MNWGRVRDFSEVRDRHRNGGDPKEEDQGAGLSVDPVMTVALIQDLNRDTVPLRMSHQRAEPVKTPAISSAAEKDCPACRPIP